MGAPKGARKADAEPEWPSHFPANCPPPSARPINERVYRRTGGTSDDWLSAKEKGTFKNGPPAMRAALSCFVDRTALEEAIAVHEEWPAREIVCADLTPEHGEIEQTGKDPHHHSLWLRRLALAAHAVLFRKAP
jgi:hypothetical protein